MLALLIVPARAWASGSSVVESSSKWLAVSIESPRKVVFDPAEEAKWHADWKKQHAPKVKKLRLRIEKALKKNRFNLLPYKKSYPEVIESDLDAAKNADIVKTPFRCRFDFENIRISMAFSAAPPPELRKSLRATLQEAISR